MCDITLGSPLAPALPAQSDALTRVEGNLGRTDCDGCIRAAKHALSANFCSNRQVPYAKD